MPQDEQRRDPVDYRYDQLNWPFIKLMAQLAAYSDTKHRDARQYTLPGATLTGDRSPRNHLVEHYQAYMTDQAHDIFVESGRSGHLVSIAYNAMMQFFYETGVQPGDVKEPVVLRPTPTAPKALKCPGCGQFACLQRIGCPEVPTLRPRCPECAANRPVDVFEDGTRLHIHGGHAIECTQQPKKLWLTDEENEKALDEWPEPRTR